VPHDDRDRLWWGCLNIAGCMCCWGAIPVVLRALSFTSIDAWTANGIRYPFAALMYWPFLIHAYRRGMVDRKLLACALIPATMALGGQIFWAQAPYHLPASSIGFFIRMATVWALIGAMILFREERRLLRSRWFWLGIGASVIGFLGLAHEKQGFDTGGSATGVAIISACSLFFGLYGVSVKFFFRGRPEWLTFGVVAQMVSVGTIIGMCLKGDVQQVRGLDSWAWTLMLTSSLVGVGVGHLFLYNAVRLIGASLTSALQNLMPLITFSLAWLCLGEQMTPREWLAGGVMLIGAGMLIRSQRKSPPVA